MEPLHHLNIFVHVAAGTAALVTGLIAIGVRNRPTAHTRFGRYFMWMMVLVIATALLGVFVFGRHSFLLIITLLSGYTCFSGIRAIRLKGRHPRPLDYGVAIAVTAPAIYYAKTAGMYWAPAVTYSTIGALVLVTAYDLSKGLFSSRFLRKAVVYEHVYKMISSLSGLASAFAGTVLPQFKPYSQLLPSALGVAGIIVIFIRLRKLPCFPL